MKLDPELARQLDAAKDTTTDVEAVLLLDQSMPVFADKVDPGAVSRLAEGVVKRVEDESGITPQVVNVLGNVGAVVVAAQEPFVRGLLAQPEFESATANETSTSALDSDLDVS